MREETVYGSLDQPAELPPPVSYANRNILHLIFNQYPSGFLDRPYGPGIKE
jgi:hypothetical protein